MAFIDTNQILYKTQYGFRKQMSTSLAIIELVEEITNSLDKHESTVGICIDLKKVFDIVDHAILIEKLYHYGIRGIYIYNSVLTRRHRHINSSASTPLNATNIAEMKVSHHGLELLFWIYKCCFLEFVCAR